MKAHAWLRDLHSICHFVSVETPPERASNSELSRWLKQGSVQVNGEKLTFEDMMDFPIISVVLFPKSEKRRCTLL